MGSEYGKTFLGFETLYEYNLVYSDLAPRVGGKGGGVTIRKQLIHHDHSKQVKLFNTYYILLKCQLKSREAKY